MVLRIECPAMRHNVWLGLVALAALGTTGCKLKLEGKATGIKPGATDIILVHVKTDPQTDLTCEGMGVTCSSTYVPGGGETDLEVKPTDMANPGKVTIKGKKGPRKGETTVDLADVPPTLSVNDYGTITCAPRKCEGVGIDL